MVSFKLSESLVDTACSFTYSSLRVPIYMRVIVRFRQIDYKREKIILNFKIYWMKSLYDATEP